CRATRRALRHPRVQAIDRPAPLGEGGGPRLVRQHPCRRKARETPQRSGATRSLRRDQHRNRSLLLSPRRPYTGLLVARPHATRTGRFFRSGPLRLARIRHRAPVARVEVGGAADERLATENAAQERSHAAPSAARAIRSPTDTPGLEPGIDFTRSMAGLLI